MGRNRQIRVFARFGTSSTVGPSRAVLLSRTRAGPDEMTDSLKKAFDAAFRLPEDEQDAVAEWLLAELQSEEEWEERFARTQDTLSALAQEALDEHERGETAELSLTDLL